MSKLLGGPTRYFNLTGISTAIALTLSGSLYAQASLTPDDMAMVEQAKELTQNTDMLDGVDWKSPKGFDAAYRDATNLIERIKGNNKAFSKKDQQEAQARENFSKQSIVVFASRSMGEEGLNNLFDAVSGMPDVVVVFRGIPQDANLGEAMLEIQSLISHRDPIPNVVINPVLFTEYDIESVPAIVVREGEEAGAGELPKSIAKVYGLNNPSWLLERIKDGEAGDLGFKGPAVTISEPDLIELMKERFTKIDWEEKKEKAVKNFWHKQSFNELPVALQNRTREIDPSIHITEDIKTEDGAIVAAKGSIINPLSLRPFTQALVVFDPSSKKQVEKVKETLPRIKNTAGVNRITYIVTKLDTEDGWDSYKEITDELDSPVFLLTPDVRDRFQIELAPSVVTAKAGSFIVEELGIQDSDSAEDGSQ